MTYTDYKSFFSQATKLSEGPYSYQESLAARKSFPELLEVPTGMGKTAAVVLAWLWTRGWRQGTRNSEPDAETPRRLVYCLPMRVLVEQTEDNVRGWLENLGILGEAGDGKVSVHVLMGGESDLKTWAEYPEEDMILIGTQDILLSRALMRGYGMSRYQWSVHFALLHNDCLWTFDEVQLMGAGLATSEQLEAFRRRYPLAKSSRTLWVSATLNRHWPATVYMQRHLASFALLVINDEDRKQASERLNSSKRVEKASISLTSETGNQNGLQAYLEALRDQVLENHDPSAKTVVTINRVDRAQQLFRLLCEERPGKPDLLIHARFRARELAEQMRRLREEPAVERIVVATQAIEAGVDISSKALMTELAPWPSLVQRFGRCNRYGEHNAEGANILWVDIEDDTDALFYMIEALENARNKLATCTSSSPQDLRTTDETRPLTAVLRRKDLLGLFNTDRDLSGFDADVSDYIRDIGLPGMQVFWRDFNDDPNNSWAEGRIESKPTRDELCPVSIGRPRIGGQYLQSLREFCDE